MNSSPACLSACWSLVSFRFGLKVFQPCRGESERWKDEHICPTYSSNCFFFSFSSFFLPFCSNITTAFPSLEELLSSSPGIPAHWVPIGGGGTANKLASKEKPPSPKIKVCVQQTCILSTLSRSRSNKPTFDSAPLSPPSTRQKQRTVFHFASSNPQSAQSRCGQSLPEKGS